MKEKFVKAIKEAFELEASEDFDLQSEFRQHDNWDSLTKLSLIAVLDEEFEVIIEEDKFEKLTKFEDILNFISAV
jgi:acyl carrier protein